MRIVVVEPHPDDAFLSLGWHLESLWRDDEKLIVTVFADDERGREAEAYADAVGAGHLCLGLPESKMSDTPFAIIPVPELRKEIEGIAAVGYDVILFPLGLQHPDHLRVAATRTPDAARYFDTPYQTKQKLAESLLSRAEGKTVGSILFPPARKWRHSVIFKSQAKFFHFNAKLKDSLLPEIVLTPT